ncbi:MAG: tryptophan synthase subunit alpha [Chitinophagaceae bacterium]|nr:MAG: tryptophan synthase subunit alpha [Chitinophagaceae bacterium]
MSRLEVLFNKKSNRILNIYCTAGFPKLMDTIPVMQALQSSGADIIELGMPYSDPLADGEVIQSSSNIAIANGMTVQELFKQLKNLRADQISGGVGNELPVVLMGYMNTVLRYGFEAFCKDASAVGIDGLILPDMPAHEYEAKYKTVLEQYQLDLIFLVTPETSENRVRYLDRLSSGFLYAVSSSSTTGNEKDFDAVTKYLQRLKSYQLKNKILVGFGIKDKTTFDAACAHADGAIIGSVFIKKLNGAEDVLKTTQDFVSSVL